MDLERVLIDTDKKHSDLVHSMAYAVASQMYKYRDDYVLLHIKKCPCYIPDFVYKWVLKQVLVMSNFKNLT